MRTQSQALHLKFYTEPQYTHKIFDIIEELLDIAIKDKERRKEFMIALGEALDNAITHGNKLDRSKVIDVDCQISEEKIICSVRDEGNGFDHKQFLTGPISDFRPMTLIQQAAKGKLGGFGLSLIKKCADEVSFSAAGDEVSFSIYLTTEHQPAKSKGNLAS
jgi:serine/threonine-protein kinase RsbW